MWWVLACVPDLPVSPWDPAHDFDEDGLSEQQGDCDDQDAAVGADPVQSWEDGDGDGLGAGDPRGGCALPAGRVDNDDDCDDADEDVGIGDPYYPDVDADGFGAGEPVYACAPYAGAVVNGDDCDDGSDRVYPGAPEACGDGIDADCAAGDLPCGLSGDLVAADASWSHTTADSMQGAVLTAFSAEVVGARGAVIGIGTRWDEVCGGCDAADGGDTAWLYGSTDAGDALRTFTFADPGEFTRLSPVGDVDGDGADDVLAASWCDDPAGCPSDGRDVWLVPGPITGDRLVDGQTATLQAGPGACPGASAAALGDLDGDGADDFVVGAPCADEVYVVRGEGALAKPGTRALSDQTTLSGAGGPGWSAASADADGDGLGDLLLGARDPADALWIDGAALLGPGGDLDAVADGRWTLGPDAGFGAQVAAAGDLDGDGLDDWSLGAGDGWAWLVCGGPVVGSGDIEDVARGSVEGPSPTFGAAVAGADDVDGDGDREILVGAPGSGGEDGAGWLLDAACVGSFAADALVRATFGPGVSKDRAYGAAVLGPGDVDGDGWSDVVIGVGELFRPDDASASALLYLGP